MISPLIQRDAEDNTTRVRTAEDTFVLQPWDSTLRGRQRDCLLVLMGPRFVVNAVLTAAELRALAQACVEVAEQIEQPMRVAA